jgi:hypothetical protein
MGLKFHEILENDFTVDSLIKRILKTELGEFVVKMKRSVLFLDALLSSLSKYLAKTAHNIDVKSWANKVLDSLIHWL